MRNISGQLGQALRGNEFLNSILQRSSIAGGGFDFDLPQYHHWLRMSHQDRVQQLEDWRNEITPVRNAVELLLSLIRTSAVPNQEQAPNGFYQKSLPGNVTAQLLRVGVPTATGLYPEISGGKHRFSIRFMDCSDLQHPMQTDRDVPFSLATCLI